MLAWQEDALLNVCVEKGEHFAEHLRRDHIWLPLSYRRHDLSIHDEAGTVPLISPMQVEATGLQQSHSLRREVWLHWNCTQPIDVLSKFYFRFFHIVEASLDPLEPVSLEETWRHLYAFATHLILQGLHACPLVLSQVVPAKVDAPIILSSLVRSNDILSIWDEVVDFGWRNIHRILAIVSRVVRIVRVRLFHRHLQLFQVLLIRPLLVPVATGSIDLIATAVDGCSLHFSSNEPRIRRGNHFLISRRLLPNTTYYYYYFLRIIF